MIKTIVCIIILLILALLMLVTWCLCKIGSICSREEEARVKNALKQSKVQPCKKYCNECECLSVTQKEQVNKKEPHICQALGKQVYHNHQYPNLPRLADCPLSNQEVNHGTSNVL
jgi:hypothetical protein